MTTAFEHNIDRALTDSDKWHKYANQDVIPLWVADTDYRSPDCVIEALHQRVEQGIFGYGYPPPELMALVVERMERLYQWKIKPEWLVFLPGLVCGLHLSVRAFTTDKQASICPNPIYPPFKKASLAVGRRQLFIPMVEKHSRWLLDLASVESKMQGDEALLMLCNPHNPGGTVYTREELTEQLAFAQRHNLTICSDEIHADLLIDPNVKHIPIASLNEDAEQRTITLLAPSKTFNIAGLGASIAIIANEKLRNKFNNTRAGIVPSVDILAYVAATAAYRGGEEWLQQKLAYLRENYALLYSRINAMPGLKMLPLQATYLAWIDASGLNIDNPHQFFEQAGVGLSPGSDFGARHFVRLNFGCSRALLTKALNRMQQAIETLQSNR